MTGRCVAVSQRGERCWLLAHPGLVHTVFRNGERRDFCEATPRWTNQDLSTGDPLRDAPEALRRLG